MLLLLFSGAKGSSAPAKVVTTCCFQPSAFQNNAFQNCGGAKVGWFDEWDKRRRHDSKDLERRLKEQRGFTYEDYEELTAPSIVSPVSAVPLKQVTIKAPGAAVAQVITVPDDFDEETILAIVASLEGADLLG